MPTSRHNIASERIDFKNESIFVQTISDKKICQQQAWTKENTKNYPLDINGSYPSSKIWKGINYDKKGTCIILNE